ncbi:TetR family transcriptional regulator, partial [Pseudomonas aeruginosa]
MARKTKEESQKTRDGILDAAERVFLEKGVGTTAMADLADAAGVSRGAVYGHYKNKIEVCLAMCDRAFGQIEVPDENARVPALDAHGRKNLTDFAEAMHQFPEVLECHVLMGAVDFMLRIVTRDIESYERFFF